MDSIQIQWTIVLMCILFSAYFSGLEMAFVSANKLRIQLDNKQGNLSTHINAYFSKNPSFFIATMLVGNNIALVIYGIFIAQLLAPYIFEYITHIEVLILIIQTIVSTLLILITAEFLPKIVFRINPNRILKGFSIPTILFYIILFPITYFTTAVSEFVLKYIMKVELDKGAVVFGRIDLDHYIKESSLNQIEAENIDHEIQIFQNALDFSNIKARECMVPRTEIVALSAENTIEELKSKFIETGLSKILIYRENMDNMIGYAHSFELFKKPDTIINILHPILVIPESMPASEALKLLISQRSSIAVVLDEFGGTAGILTMEDIIEEIFGEIEDEHDKEDLIETQLSPREFLFSARLEIDLLNEKYKLRLPEDEAYETLGGLIINRCGRIPKAKEIIHIQNMDLHIERVLQNKIELIRLNLTEII